MGLAASQARFLGLTARKSNVEYQGQQINQQRTALSNEVNGLYSKYNALTVPVPPSSSDYIKNSYTFESTSEDYTISDYSKITDQSDPYYGYNKLTLQYTEDVAQVKSNTVSNAVISGKKSDEGNGSYSSLSFTVGTSVYKYDESDPETSTIDKIDTAAEGFDASKYDGLQEVMKYDQEKTGSTSRYYYRYISNENNRSFYTTGSDLDDTFATAGSERYSGTYLFEYQGTKEKTSTISAIGSVSQSSDGRLTAVNVVSCDEDPHLVGNTYDISTSSTEDETAYNDAMNKYYYDKQKYEQEVEKINKQTEKIQTEDKSLELKLRQLDTEQNALKTEMESVQKVIEDTVESIFKTYQS